MTGAVVTAQCRELLARAARWRLLGLLFERPRSGWREQVHSLAAEVQDDELVRAARRAAAQATESLFLAVLGPGGEASPREVACRPLGDPGRVLAELAACYAAFAFAPTTEEPPDHVSVEVGFAGYLLLKEAFACAAGDPEARSLAAAAGEEFRREHLAALAATLPQGLRVHRDTYLGDAARLLQQWVGPVPAACGAGVLSCRSEDESPCGVCCPLGPQDPPAGIGP
ncbi:MAG: molecular chaperone TorD family protein [Candidatus Latescibacterota bacterium]